MELLTIGQAAKALGLSIPTMRRLADSRKIPFTKLPSGYRRWTRAQIADARRRMTVEADDSVIAEAV